MGRSDFVGRTRELGVLAEEFAAVQVGGGDRPGRCVVIGGRRRSGKTRLVQEFIERAHAPSVFFTAAGISPVQELANLVEAITISGLADGSAEQQPSTWDTAFRTLADVLPTDRPSIVVIDEFSHLIERVDNVEPSLLAVWDEVMAAKPVLLLLVGSDLLRAGEQRRPGQRLRQNARQLAVDPLSPADVQDMTGLTASEALEARLVTGGMPLLCREWRPGRKLTSFLRSGLVNPATPLVSSGQTLMGVDVPDEAHGRIMLPAIATGEGSFTAILRAADVNRMTFNRSLEILTRKGVAVGDRPLSTWPSRESRYRIADSYFGFWLRFVMPYLGEIERDRSDLTLRRIQAAWPAWRAWAIRPLVRASLDRLLRRLDAPWLDHGSATVIGGYWTRSNSVVVDLVGADHAPTANRIGLVGAVHWENSGGFDPMRVAALAEARERIPGAELYTPMIVVSREPTEVVGVDATFYADDLVAAWRP
ncbi:ATP-binding protein [Phytoactinopolyspora limicola]|uniref:ATP-binding protein n=1 Tax=Phytoactinopolyspora limicola TaxID=2715536 RepID=UPI00140CC02C|nr:ATP-binding protein [Phytoactinopolyspora limicola]